MKLNRVLSYFEASCHAVQVPKGCTLMVKLEQMAFHVWLDSTEAHVTRDWRNCTKVAS